MNWQAQDIITLILWAVSIGAALLVAWKAPPLFFLYKGFVKADLKECDRQRGSLSELRQALVKAEKLTGRDLRCLRRSLSNIYHPATWAAIEGLVAKEAVSEDDLDNLTLAISSDEATSLPFWRRFRWGAREILSRFWFSRTFKKEGQAVNSTAVPAPRITVKIPQPAIHVAAHAQVSTTPSRAVMAKQHSATP
ncbi:MAG: hypothetical protein QOJ27_132 [Sphingomonadales bacterium]|nr:hypothetical protein [Sphingomonadales bacterium]